MSKKACVLLGTWMFLLVLAGCTGKGDQSTRVEDLPEPPYILKEGCTFTIVHENGSVSVDSPRITGPATGSASVTDGVYTLEVADCEVVSCSHALGIFER